MDLRPLLRPRHLTLTVLVGLLAGATITAATVGIEPDVPTALSAPVSFPAPAVGDHGTYDIWHYEEGDGKDPATWGEPDRTFSFEWGADEIRLDGNGDRVWANLLHTYETYDDSAGDLIHRNDTRYLYAGTDISFETTSESADHYVQEGGGYSPTATYTTDISGTHSWYGNDRLWEGNPCLRTPLQGTVLDLGETSIAGLDCWWGSNDARVRVDSVGGVLGERDVLLVARETNDLQLPYIMGRIWVREGIAYPIRLEEVWNDEPEAVAVLREFDAGSVPLRGESPIVESLPPLDWAPRQVWGPDETGIEHPFPLSAAFAAARDAGDFPALRQFLADHPAAYVGWGQYTAYDTPDRVDLRWQFSVVDGAANQSVDILLRQPKPRLMLAPVPGVDADPSFVIDEEPLTPPYGPFIPLAAQDAPATLPTVASLLALWQAHAGTTEAGNAWSFHLGADPDGPGGYAGLGMTAGIVQYKGVGDVPGFLGQLGPRDQTWTFSRIALDDTLGTVLGFGESTSASRAEEVPLPASTVPGSPSPAVAAPPATATSVKARGMWELTPIEQAGIGVGALLLAGLYWIAPALKNGVVGLFSRIRDDDLLENPSRRLLRDLVEQTPGIHHQELVRRLGKGKGGAEHHLRKLVEGGVLVSRSSPGYTCYWVPGQATKVAIAAAPALKSPIAQGIVRLRLQQPGISNADLARALAVRPATIHYHVERLRAAGVLTANGHAMPGMVDAQDDSAAAA